MKTYYYNVDDREFTLASGDRLRVVPELFYQERAVWRLCLRNGRGLPIDISGVTAWQAAVDNNYCSGSAPMCRVLADGIIADVESGAVEISLDAASAEFLSAVNGATVKPAYFELVGFNSRGDRALFVSFEIAARMTLDPDPTAPGEIPESLATKTQVSAIVGAAVSTASGALQTQLDTVSGGLQERPTSSGAETIASGAAVNVLTPVSTALQEQIDHLPTGGGMVEVVSGGNVGYIPVLSGGVCYRFTAPLVSLTVGSITSSLQESDILFVAGAVVSPPATVALKYQTGENYEWVDDEDGGHDEITQTYTSITLASSGTGYAYSVPAELEWYEFSGEDDRCGSSYLSAGSLTCTSAGGKWVISAHNVTQVIYDEWKEWDEDEGDDVMKSSTTSRALNTWIASSTDLATWTVNTADGAKIVAKWWSEWEWSESETEASPEIVASAVITPCDVVLPSGALLVNSSAVTVESGHRYEMNVKYGAIVTGEWQEIGE